MFLATSGQELFPTCSKKFAVLPVVELAYKEDIAMDSRDEGGRWILTDGLDFLLCQVCQMVYAVLVGNLIELQVVHPVEPAKLQPVLMGRFVGGRRDSLVDYLFQFFRVGQRVKVREHAMHSIWVIIW